MTEKQRDVLNIAGIVLIWVIIICPTITGGIHHFLLMLGVLK